MAQPGKAPTAGRTLQIAITYKPSTSEWKANPPEPPAAAVDNQGQVTFHCSQSGGCRVYTSPADAFVNEANGCLQLSHGNNNSPWRPVPMTPSSITAFAVPPKVASRLAPKRRVVTQFSQAIRQNEAEKEKKRSEAE